MRCFFLIFILITSCNTDSEVLENQDVLNVKILSLGDSYTIGEGVCDNCIVNNHNSIKKEYTPQYQDFYLL